MGQRANFIVVERGKRTLYYDHWAANALDSHLFWGPEEALAFIRQRNPEPEAWLDTVWCEGAAVVDVDRRCLLWFGGEDVLWDVPLRRTLLDLMGFTWPGWEIRWALEGILDVADYLGLPRARFRAGSRSPERLFLNEKFPEDNSVLLSIGQPDGAVHVGRLCGDGESLAIGPSLLGIISAHCRPRPLTWTGEFPKGGLHVDVRERTLWTWWANGAEDLPELAASSWNGWAANWWGDQCERHLALLGTRVSIQIPTVAERQRLLLRSLASQAPRDARNPARELASRIGERVEISAATDACRASAGDADPGSCCCGAWPIGSGSGRWTSVVGNTAQLRTARRRLAALPSPLRS